MVALEKQSQEDQELEASLDCIVRHIERPCLKERRKRRRRRQQVMSRVPHVQK